MGIDSAENFTSIYISRIVYYDTSAIKFYSDECEIYRPSEARVIIAFVMIKHLCTSAVCDFTIQRGLSAHLSSSSLQQKVPKDFS